MSEIKIFTIPNAATVANLICGVTGIIYCFSNRIDYACYLIFSASFFDFIDGFLARVFKSDSELGKELDSLCDVVSFGVLPGFIMYSLLVEYKFVALLIPVLSALRLAKFNVDERQSDVFIGVPTPMNAFFISGLAFLFPKGILNVESNFFLLALITISSFLLIAEFPLLSLKFKTFTIKDNQFRYLLIIIALVLLIVMKFESLAVLYFVYIGLSLLNNFINRKNAFRT